MFTQQKQLRKPITYKLEHYFKSINIQKSDFDNR